MFAIALIAILFAQGNALVNGDGSPVNPQPVTLELLEQERVNAYQTVLECTNKVLNNRRVNCDSEIKHYNEVSQQFLDMESKASNVDHNDV